MEIKILSEQNLRQYGRAIVNSIRKDEDYWVSLSVDVDDDALATGCQLSLTAEATQAVDADSCRGIFLVIAEREEVYLPKLGQKHAYITDFISGRTLDGLREVEARMVNVGGAATLRLKAVERERMPEVRWAEIGINLAQMPPYGPPPYCPVTLEDYNRIRSGELSGVKFINTASDPEVVERCCRMTAVVNYSGAGGVFTAGLELSTFENNGCTVRPIVTTDGYIYLEVNTP